MSDLGTVNVELSLHKSTQPIWEMTFHVVLGCKCYTRQRWQPTACKIAYKNPMLDMMCPEMDM